MGTPSFVVPCEDSIGGLKINEVVALDEFFEYVTIRFQMQPSTLLFLEVGYHVEITSQKLEGMGSL